jgi:membrane-associated phospholipid phosphatase
MIQTPLASLLSPPAGGGLNDALAQALNSLMGRSWLFDTLVALPLENDWVKAGVVGACFFAAWQERESWRETQAARRTLLVALVAALLAVAATKTVSKAVALPRPYVQSQKTYLFVNDALVENHRLDYRVPLDASGQAGQRDLLRGDVPANDLGSFPSDHASFFVALAAGVWLASRRAGWVALAWTGGVILLSKMLAGQHTPLDVAAGALVGALAQLGCQFAARRWLGGLLDRAAWWTIEHGALAGALAFVAVFEFTSTLDHLKPLAKLAVEVGKHLLRG